MSLRPDCRVLVVDDNVPSAMTLMWMAEAEGCNVQMCHDGQTALSMCQTFRPDIIFLDLGMGGMNGIEVCEALRREAAFANVRIVAQTGWGDAKIREQTRRAGFNEHLVKPVDPERLQAIIGEVGDSRLAA